MIPLWEGQCLSPPKVRFLISNRRIGRRGKGLPASRTILALGIEVAVCNVGVKIGATGLCIMDVESARQSSPLAPSLLHGRGP